MVKQVVKPQGKSCIYFPNQYSSHSITQVLSDSRGDTIITQTVMQSLSCERLTSSSWRNNRLLRGCGISTKTWNSFCLVEVLEPVFINQSKSELVTEKAAQARNVIMEKVRWYLRKCQRRAIVNKKEWKTGSLTSFRALDFEELDTWTVRISVL